MERLKRSPVPRKSEIQNGKCRWVSGLEDNPLRSLALLSGLVAQSLKHSFSWKVACVCSWIVLSACFLPIDFWESISLLLIFKNFLCFCFLGLHPWHMEVLRLGVELELTCATYPTAHSDTRSPIHWARPGIEPSSPWTPVGFVNCWATKGTP